jgi:hypothetical protein
MEEPGQRGGDAWRADVWAERGDTKLAVEIQRSYQHLREYQRRQRRYRDAGILALWLLHTDRFRTLVGSMAKERFRTDLGGKWPECGHFGPCLSNIPVAVLSFDPDPAVSGAGLFASTLPNLLSAVLAGRFLCIDGNWRIDNHTNRAELERIDGAAAQ